MPRSWQDLWKKRQKWLNPACLLAAGLLAVYVGIIQPLNRVRFVDQSKATGSSATEWEPVSLWQERHLWRTSHAQGTVGGVPGGVANEKESGLRQYAMLGTPAGPPPPPPRGSAAAAEDNDESRKLVRTGAMDLIVSNPTEAAEKIRRLAENSGGFLVSSRVGGEQEAAGAEVVVRVPTARFEEVRGEIRKLGLRVESDRLEAQDVTRDYVDREARLRNLRAQERQYLTILKHAATVKDTLEVTDKLDGVRSEIDQQQAEFEALSKQVENVALTVTLSSEADTQVFGLRWRPLYRLKLSAREGLDGLADYTATMTSFVFYLPTILLWLGTILAGAAITWRILRWSGRALFGFFKPAVEGGAAKQ
jgi:Domain of unknown function (DUF4349)